MRLVLIIQMDYKKWRKKNWLAETRRERGGEGEAEGKERENIFLLCEPTYT